MQALLEAKAKGLTRSGISKLHHSVDGKGYCRGEREPYRRNQIEAISRTAGDKPGG